ncbi:MAG: hypothetical protein ACE5G8_13845, partial [Anaerolineae bacterium]
QINKFAAPNPVRAGELLTYTIIYRNSAGMPLANVQIADTMPPQITGLVFSDTGGAAVLDGSLPDLAFNRASLATGGVMTITLVGRVAQTGWPPSLVDVVNVVTATNATTPSVETWQAVSSGGPNVPDAISLQVVPSTALVGSSVAITASVSDRYGNPALNGTPVSFSVTAGGNLNPSDDTTSGGLAATALTAGQDGTLTVTVAGGAVTATTTITFVRADQVNLDLSVRKTAWPAAVSPGANLYFTVQVTNTGDIFAGNVLVSDTLDGNLTFVGASRPLVQPQSGPAYRFAMGNLDVNQSKTVVITTLVNAAAGNVVISNTASATATGFTSVRSSGVVTAQATTSGGQLPVLQKTVSPATVRAGDPLTYTIVYQNRNIFAVPNLILTDTLPAQVAGIVFSDTGGATLVGGSVVLPQLVFNLPSLAASSSLTITLVGRAADTGWPSDAPVLLTNRASAASSVFTAPAAAQVTSNGRPNVTANIDVQASAVTPTVGSSVVITATLTDRHANPVFNGTTVNFSAAPIGSTVPVTATTAGGVATTTLSAAQTGVTTVTVTADGVLTRTVITFRTSTFPVYLPLLLTEFNF